MHKITAGLLAICVMLGTVSIVIAQPSPTSASADPSVQVFFQHIKNWKGSARNRSVVAQELIREFDSIVPAHRAAPWTVHLSMFDLVGSPKPSNMVNRLLDAIRRSKARVNVILDAHEASDATVRHPRCRALAASNTPAGWTSAAATLWCIATVNGSAPRRFMTCSGGCSHHSGDVSAIDHNKFVLFAGPAGQRAVFSSSANWTPAQLTNRFQTLIEIRNRTAVFDSWSAYWESLRAHRSPPPDYDGYGVDVHYFPRAGDPQLAALNKLDCRRGGIVRIDSNDFNDRDIIPQLNSMASAGCTVRVLVASDGKHGDGLQNLATRCLPRMHSKDMIIQGYYRGSGAPELSVWTGSRPFSNGRDASDNVVVRLRGRAWVDRFAANFDPMYRSRLARPCAMTAAAK